MIKIDLSDYPKIITAFREIVQRITADLPADQAAQTEKDLLTVLGIAEPQKYTFVIEVVVDEKPNLHYDDKLTTDIILTDLKAALTSKLRSMSDEGAKLALGSMVCTEAPPQPVPPIIEEEEDEEEDLEEDLEEVEDDDGE